MDELQSQGENSPKNAGDDANPKNSRPSFWKRRPVIVVGTVVLAGLLFLGLHYLSDAYTHESTDNAFLDGDIVSIAPKVAGQVKKVHVQQNQPVKADELLVEIDPRDFEMVLAQKKSALAAAEANEKVIKASFELLATQVQTATATAKQSEAEAEADQAKADKAAADLKRAEDLIQRKIISPQEYDSAKAAATAATATSNAGKEKAASDLSKVDAAKAQLEAGRRAFERAQAQSEESNVDMRQAELNLSYTRIVAPEDGRITRKAVEDGDYVQVGQKLMALVLPRLWVTANFKETQLKKIRVGQPVDISIDSITGEGFRGHVESIQAGSGAAFSLLPPENAVGNYVKVVQRVPVRIFFDAPLKTDHVVGPGMSVVPSVRVRSFEIADSEILIAAVLLAVIGGIFWWRIAMRPSEINSREPQP